MLSNCFEHALMLNNTNPLFDNVEFREETEDTEDLFLADFERQENIMFVDKTLSETDPNLGGNATFGNRNYLMFIQNYHEVYKKSKLPAIS